MMPPNEASRTRQGLFTDLPRETVRKGYEQQSERGLGRYMERKMDRKATPWRPVRLCWERLRDFSDSLRRKILGNSASGDAGARKFKRLRAPQVAYARELEPPPLDTQALPVWSYALILHCGGVAPKSRYHLAMGLGLRERVFVHPSHMKRRKLHHLLSLANHPIRPLQMVWPLSV